MIGAMLAAAVTTMASWEAIWWARRRHRRGIVYRQALNHAQMLGRPLVVIGAPDGGVTRGYGCGDVTVDLAGSACPVTVAADITKPLLFADNSVCVVVMCVLEYVDDANAALQEIMRISGGHAFFVGVEPWCLTATLYPGAKRSLPPQYR
jgi:hypothetical protein